MRHVNPRERIVGSVLVNSASKHDVSLCASAPKAHLVRFRLIRRATLAQGFGQEP